MGEGDQKVQTSSYKISPGNVMYSMMTVVLKNKKEKKKTSHHASVRSVQWHHIDKTLLPVRILCPKGNHSLKWGELP